MADESFDLTYGTEKKRAEAVLARVGAKPWGPASAYFWMVPFFEEIVARIENLNARLEAVEKHLENSR